MKIYFCGSIRAGRNEEQKTQIIDEMRQAIHEHAGLALDDINVVIRDTPASWVMEGGDIMPEPGEEEAWFAAHEAKKAAEHAFADAGDMLGMTHVVETLFERA